MTPSEVLRAAKAKIDKPEHWAQGFFAFRPANLASEDEQFRKVYVLNGKAMFMTRYEDPRAECFCITGSVFSVSRDPEMISLGAWPYLYSAFRQMTQASPAMVIGMKEIVAFNDAPVRRHIDVIQLLDIAIRLAEEDEQADDHPEAHK